MRCAHSACFLCSHPCEVRCTHASELDPPTHEYFAYPTHEFAHASLHNCRYVYNPVRFFVQNVHPMQRLLAKHMRMAVDVLYFLELIRHPMPALPSTSSLTPLSATINRDAQVRETYNHMCNVITVDGNYSIQAFTCIVNFSNDTKTKAAWCCLCSIDRFATNTNKYDIVQQVLGHHQRHIWICQHMTLLRFVLPIACYLQFQGQ